MEKTMFKIRFRDIFALVINISILILWGLQASQYIGQLPGEINGVLMAAFMLIIQFYFRKKPRGETHG